MGHQPRWQHDKQPGDGIGPYGFDDGQTPSPVETLKIALTRTDPATTSATHGKLDIAWENVTASVPFTVK